jgi:Flp pilus assembly protein TadG
MRILTSLRQPQRLVADQNAERKGTAMVECAITLPMLIVLALGTLEIGSALRAATILESACRESGRMAAMDWRYIVLQNQTPNQKVIQDLKNFITASGLQGNQSTVTLTHADGTSAGQTFDLANENNDLKFVKITVSLPYSTVSVFPLSYLRGKSLKARVVMRATTRGGSLSN